MSYHAVLCCLHHLHPHHNHTTTLSPPFLLPFLLSPSCLSSSLCSYMEVPNKSAGSSAVSKFGTRTESAGVLRFKCHSIAYTPPLAPPGGYAASASEASLLQSGGGGRGESMSMSRHGSAEGSLSHRAGAGVPKRTVEDILNSYKSTELLSRYGGLSVCHPAILPSCLLYFILLNLPLAFLLLRSTHTHRIASPLHTHT